MKIIPLQDKNSNIIKRIKKDLIINKINNIEKVDNYNENNNNPILKMENNYDMNNNSLS